MSWVGVEKRTRWPQFDLADWPGPQSQIDSARLSSIFSRRARKEVGAAGSSAINRGYLLKNRQNALYRTRFTSTVPSGFSLVIA